MVICRYRLFIGVNMNLDLYKTNDPDNVVGKTITGKQTISINLKRDTNVIAPVILLVKVEGVVFSDFNYCHIPDLGRYYFIRNVEILNNEVSALTLECDYLETYKSDILASNAQFRTPIKSGLYGDLQLNTTGVMNEVQYLSNIELVPSDSAVLSIMRWQ